MTSPTVGRISDCGDNEPPESTDLCPSGGDSELELDDILSMLDAFVGQSPCDDPCPA